MKKTDLSAVIAGRLEDMADQCQRLFDEGNFAEAELLRDEGLLIAEAYDNGDDFFFIGSISSK